MSWVWGYKIKIKNLRCNKFQSLLAFWRRGFASWRRSTCLSQIYNSSGHLRILSWVQTRIGSCWGHCPWRTLLAWDWTHCPDLKPPRTPTSLRSHSSFGTWSPPPSSSGWPQRVRARRHCSARTCFTLYLRKPRTPPARVFGRGGPSSPTWTHRIAPSWSSFSSPCWTSEIEGVSWSACPMPSTSSPGSPQGLAATRHSKPAQIFCPNRPPHQKPFCPHIML